ncbi:MAG: hypothetical protein Q8760_00720 [Candidatus Phytoplasma australasiaticum]|nr:hypothetical protein [Candidatus Phytoplasma australasiaticum]
MLKLIKNNILLFSVSLACLLTIFTINNAKISIKAYDKGQYFDAVVSANIDKKEKILSLMQFNIIEDAKDVIKQHTVKVGLEAFMNYLFQDYFGVDEWDEETQQFTQFDSDVNLPENYFTTILPDEINREFIQPLFLQMKKTVSTSIIDQIKNFLTTDYISQQITRAINSLSSKS